MSVARCMVMVCALGACSDDRTEVKLPTSADPPAPSVSATTRPRTRFYYVVREEDACAVFWEEAAEVSVKKEIPCPREIEDGERLRLSGRTCMRESSRAERNLPVRCPKHIFYAERDDHLGKGEFKLRAQK